MKPAVNPDLDLTLERVIKAPRTVVWKAWTEAAKLEQWWIPAPAKCKVITLDPRPGGAFVTEMSEDGAAFFPHVNASFLAVDEPERIVFTDALVGGWRPAEQPFMTAILLFEEHPEGTKYSAHVMHKSREVRDEHEKLGFYDGWGAVAQQLADLVEGKAGGGALPADRGDGQA